MCITALSPYSKQHCRLHTRWR